MTHLEFAQAVSLIIAAMLAGALAFCRLFITKTNATYERSRWLLVAMMSLVALQYVVQLVFHVRASNYNAGCLINIIFYVPATILMFFSTTNLLDGGRLKRSYLVFGVSMCIIIWLIGLVGCIAYGTMALPTWLLVVMMSLFFIGNLHVISIQGSKFRKARRTIGQDLGNPAGNFVSHLRIGSYCIYALSVILPFTLLDIHAIALLGVAMLPAFYILTLSFICLGSNMQGVLEAIDNSHTAEVTERPYEPIESITEDNISRIEDMISDWRASRGFADKDLSVSTFARKVGIPQRIVSSFINSHEGRTFRSWITQIRVEEAKKLMVEKPFYSAEAIAEECGFSSRSFFQTSFKNATGMTPREWLEKQ